MQVEETAHDIASVLMDGGSVANDVACISEDIGKHSFGSTVSDVKQLVGDVAHMKSDVEKLQQDGGSSWLSSLFSVIAYWIPSVFRGV